MGLNRVVRIAAVLVQDLQPGSGFKEAWTKWQKTIQAGAEIPHMAAAPPLGTCCLLAVWSACRHLVSLYSDVAENQMRRIGGGVMQTTKSPRSARPWRQRSSRRQRRPWRRKRRS